MLTACCSRIVIGTVASIMREKVVPQHEEMLLVEDNNSETDEWYSFLIMYIPYKKTMFPQNAFLIFNDSKVASAKNPYTETNRI
jgi:hypothetical protein